jgi:NDP-sugar pyrophosphorylase family protein
MKAIVLAAGTGSRMGTLTADVPKPMLRVGDEPLLAHTLRWLAANRIEDVAINLHHLPAVIPSYFGDGARHGVRIRYAPEERLLGTAGTVRALAPFLGDEDEVLVVYGDLLIDQDIGELIRAHRQRAADATLLVHQRKGSNSLVRLADDGRIERFIERPDDAERAANPFPWVNSGLAILGPRLRAAIPTTTPADLPRDVYIPELERLRLYGAPLTGYRCAIDSPERLAAADEAFRSKKFRVSSS